MACAAHTDPCVERAFIGDYFGLSISKGNVYTLAVSIHLPLRRDRRQQRLRLLPAAGT
jgi:hypothetical protein